VTKPPKPCKDCRAENILRIRPAPFPGPRCYLHHKAEERRRRMAAAAGRRQRTYGLTDEEYRRLLEVQGGRCAVCRRAKGNPNGDKGKRHLAVDHDHSCCAGPTSCGRCVRGLLCGPCNDQMAHARDDPEHFLRAARYLREWPSLAARI
jgi:hypothetical protein